MKKLFKYSVFAIFIVCALWVMDVTAAEIGDVAIIKEQAAEPILKLDSSDVIIKKGYNKVIKANITKDEADDAQYTVTWKSSDEAVAKVDKTGKIVGVTTGTCEVTATIEGTEISKTISVRVIVNPKVSVKPTKIVLNRSKSQTLKATISTSKYDAEKYTIKWTSSNKKVATVTSSGKVTAKGIGTCRIKATIDGTTIYDSCNVTVKLIKGNKLKYGAKYDKTVTASSLKKKVSSTAIVKDNAGNEYTRGKKLGSFTLTGYCTKCNCGGSRVTSTGKTATAGITVAVNPKQIKPGTKIIIGDHVYIAQDIHGNRRYSKVIDVFFGTKHGSEGLWKNVPVYLAE